MWTVFHCFVSRAFRWEARATRMTPLRLGPSRVVVACYYFFSERTAELDTAIEGQVQAIKTLWGHSSVGCLRLLFCGR